MGDLGQQWITAMRARRFEEAWRLSDAALAARDPATRDDPALPYHMRWVWDGRPFDGREVLVRCYHGLGDTIQYARYLPLLARRAASLTVEAPARLHSLLSRIEGIDRLGAFDPARPLPPAQCDIEITELAFALRTAPDAMACPYLTASPQPLPSGTIGLCYAAGDWDPDRSVPPALFEGICARHRCVSLVAEPSPLPVENPQGCPFDLAATASLVAGTSLIITVDTMIAHLAGALGRPTWLLLKAEPDWRWSPEEETSPWYPSLRLFAQPRPGDWRAVIDRVERALAAEYTSMKEDLADAATSLPVGARVLG